MKGIINKFIAVIWWFSTLSERYDAERRTSAKHKKKVAIVKNIWIVAGILIIAVLQFLVAAGLSAVIGLATTFLSFMILDETE